MVKYTLHYFNLRGRAEVSRLILKQAGVQFVDHRFEPPEWPAFKEAMNNKLPFGQVPVLELDDGTVIGQSLAIARYLAKKYGDARDTILCTKSCPSRPLDARMFVPGLAGESDIESAQIDSICHAYDDFLVEMRPWMVAKVMEKNLEKAEEVKKTLLSDTVPKYVNRFEGFLKRNKSGWLVGQKLSWADLLISEFLHRLGEAFEADILKDCPELMGHQKRVFALPNIKKWLEERPKTSM